MWARAGGIGKRETTDPELAPVEHRYGGSARSIGDPALTVSTDASFVVDRLNRRRRYRQFGGFRVKTLAVYLGVLFGTETL